MPAQSVSVIVPVQGARTRREETRLPPRRQGAKEKRGGVRRRGACPGSQVRVQQPVGRALRAGDRVQPPVARALPARDRVQPLVARALQARDPVLPRSPPFPWRPILASWRLGGPLLSCLTLSAPYSLLVWVGLAAWSEPVSSESLVKRRGAVG